MSKDEEKLGFGDQPLRQPMLIAHDPFARPGQGRKVVGSTNTADRILAVIRRLGRRFGESRPDNPFRQATPEAVAAALQDPELADIASGHPELAEPGIQYFPEPGQPIVYRDPESGRYSLLEAPVVPPVEAVKGSDGRVRIPGGKPVNPDTINFNIVDGHRSRPRTR